MDLGLAALGTKMDLGLASPGTRGHAENNLKETCSEFVRENGALHDCEAWL